MCLLSRGKRARQMHRYPQQFERTIQFSRTERKLVSVEGAKTLDDLTVSVNRKSLFFDSIRAHPRRGMCPDLFPRLSEREVSAVPCGRQRPRPSNNGE